MYLYFSIKLIYTSKVQIFFVIKERVFALLQSKDSFWLDLTKDWILRESWLLKSANTLPDVTDS